MVVDHRVLDLARIVTKEHYGNLRFSNFEQLKTVTLDSVKVNVLDNIQQIRSDSNVSEITAKSNKIK